jgi:hypothetical protein
MAEDDDDGTGFNRHEKVVATEDLPGVPAGTPGKVLLVNGIDWIRYRVLFENGVERGTIDGKYLARRKDWERAEAERAAAERAEQFN